MQITIPKSNRKKGKTYRKQKQNKIKRLHRYKMKKVMKKR
jgi:hypothetical protein